MEREIVRVSKKEVGVKGDGKIENVIVMMQVMKKFEK